MQAVWRFLLDEDFINAYKTGIVIKFPDGIFRRVFPRIFTYAADYPEKYICDHIYINLLTLSFNRILLACMKFLGRCPCPRCFVSKEKIDCLGGKHDRWVRTHSHRTDNQQQRNWIERVREMIFVMGRGVTSQAVKALIGAISLVPIRVRNPSPGI